MSCCAGPEWPRNTEPNGECPECGTDTVDGEAYEQCGYGAIACEKCESKPCDGSC